MSPVRSIATALAAGALAGLLALGLGGRLAMAVLVVARDARPAVSLGGSLEVLAVGTGYGAVGGLVALGAGRVLGPRTGRWHGIGLGLALLVAAWLTSSTGRSAAAGLEAQGTLAVALAVLCFGGFGLLLHGLLARWLPPPDARHEPAV
ncbi:MAG: hypothetical protein ACREOF_21815 [Gemmatimonadales bacterium]